MEGREGSERRSHKEEEREGGGGTEKEAQGPLAEEGGLYFDICTVVPEFLVTPLLMGPTYPGPV